MQFDPKKLGEEADEMIAKLNRDGEVDDESTEVVDEDQSAVEEAITESTDEVEDDQGTGVSEVVDKPVESASEELSLLRKQVEASEQRWKVLQGMINKKDEEIEAMRNLLAEMHNQSQQAPSAQTKQEVKPLVTNDDISEYGEDMIDLITRASTQASANLMQESVAKLLERISSLENSLQGVQKESKTVAENSFYTELGKLVPNYAELNTDNSFLQWLGNVDPFTGETKLSLLQDAQAKGDVRRVATFFNTFINDSAPREVEPTTNVSAKDKLVTPGKAKQATPRQDEKRTWTRAEIAKLYDDKMAGRISAKKFEELERDIFAAQLENRVAS